MAKWARILLRLVTVLLALLAFRDLSAIVCGGPFTADTYYLPLRDIDVGKSRDLIETTIIKTHTAAVKWEHGILLIAHLLAFLMTLIALKCLGKHEPGLRPSDLR